MEIEKTPLIKHHSQIIVASKNHFWMLKLDGKSIMMNRIFVYSQIIFSQCVF